MYQVPWSEQRWSPPALADRLAIIQRLRALVCQNRERLLDSLVGIRRVSRFEILTSEILPFLDACAWLTREAPKLLAPRSPSFWSAPLWMSGHRLTTRRVPYGRVLIFGPGNYPFFLAATHAVQALAAGNRVRLKAKEGCNGPLLILEELLREAGQESGSFELLAEDQLDVQKLMDEGVELFVLTGAASTGRLLLPQFAERAIPCIAELSGQDVLCLCPDGNAADAILALRWARQLNSGNTCMVPVEFWAPYSRRGQFTDLDVPVTYYENLKQVEDWLLHRPGLGLSLFGEDDAQQLLPSVRTGFVCINDCIAPTADPRASFTGTAQSGFGSTRGPEGLLAMTVPQNSFVNRGPRMHLKPPLQCSHIIMQCYTDLAHGSLAKKLQACVKLVPALSLWPFEKLWRGKGVPSRQGEAPLTPTPLKVNSQSE